MNYNEDEHDEKYIGWQDKHIQDCLILYNFVITIVKNGYYSILHVPTSSKVEICAQLKH